MTPDEWFFSLPIFTRTAFVSSFAMTLLSAFSLVSASNFYFFPELIWKKFQLWRAVLPFFYFGEFSMSFVFMLYMLVTYLRQLEEGCFRGTRGKVSLLAFFTYVVTAVFLIHTFYYNIYFPGPVFLSTIIYVWSRQNVDTPVNMYGFTLKAWHVPYAMMLLTLLFGGSMINDFIGILIGHVYHYTVQIIPRRYNVTVFKVPEPVFALAEKIADRIEKKDSVGAAFVSAAASTAPRFARRTTGYRLGED